MSIPVIAVFDVGKTNKKLFLFDENYAIVYERTARFVETTDEDGDPCENLESLISSVYDSLHQIMQLTEFEVKAINFSTYGASFVYLDENGKPLTPLYNYLKDYPEALKNEFYGKYGGEALLAKETASPILGSLNSGLQLYRLKKEQPQVYKKLKYALHLPQYLSYLITKKTCTDITSIGCHTHLWDFNKNKYHHWVFNEQLDEKLGELLPADSSITAEYEGLKVKVGVGLHDSSAALIPYLANFNEPFVLLSTGTWCISLNPFNQSPLTAEELDQDCLCYMHYKGKAVKASRIFAGYEHDQEVTRIAEHFNIAAHTLKSLKYSSKTIAKLCSKITENNQDADSFSAKSLFSNRDLNQFKNGAEAYHQLIFDLVKQQVFSTRLILSKDIKRIFVDGGFSKNEIFMHLLADKLPEVEIFASYISQATAIGSALAIHQAWNQGSVPSDIIRLKYYAGKQLDF
jgi:sugar (pentulose or hexulose) kinase